MSSSSAGLPTPESPGSVSGAPNLPAGFTGTFTSRYIDTGELRLHAVSGSFGFYRSIPPPAHRTGSARTGGCPCPCWRSAARKAPVKGSGNTMKLAADDVQTVVLAGSGHWVAEQAPEELLAALTVFLAPYRDGTAAAD